MSVRDEVLRMPHELLRDLGRNGSARKEFRAAAISRLRELHHPYAEHPELRDFIHPSGQDYARPTGSSGQPLTDDEILDRLIDGVPVEVEPEIHNPVELVGIDDDALRNDVGEPLPVDVDTGPFKASVTTDTLLREEGPIPILDGIGDDETELLLRALDPLEPMFVSEK